MRRKTGVEMSWERFKAKVSLQLLSFFLEKCIILKGSMPGTAVTP